MAQGPDGTLPAWGARQASLHPRKSHHGLGEWAPRALAKARGILRSRGSHMRRREGRAVLSATTGWLVRLWKRLIQRSEEHTSELQSLRHLVCRLLIEKTSTLI